MNFLLHHQLASLHHPGRPATAAGAMLPDVWRMADRRAHTRVIERGGDLDASPALRDVSDGIAHHLEVDAWFHRAPVFLRGEAAAREVLGRVPGPRKIGLFAHVAWELCLDGALVRRTGVHALLHALRASVAAVRPEAHHRAADRHVDLLPGERSGFDARVDSILDAMVAGPWVAGYATAPGIVERLDGVRRRLGFAPLLAPERDDLALGFQTLEAPADAALDEIASTRS